jgi:hypothetical protein
MEQDIGRRRMVWRCLGLAGVWFVLFVLLSICSFEKNQCSFCDDWEIHVGFPPWLYGNGGCWDGDRYRGFWAALPESRWSLRAPRLLAAASVAWAPLAVGVMVFLYIRKRLQVCLTTAIVLTLVAQALLGANVLQRAGAEPSGWGWPMDGSQEESQHALGGATESDLMRLLQNGCVAIAVLFFTGIVLEWWLRRKRTRPPQSPSAVRSL